MPPEAARLHRLLRLEKVRAITKQTAAAEAAEAEGTLAQLETLVTRTARLAEGYRPGPALSDGLALRHIGAFVGGLGQVVAATRGDAERARQIADRKQQELARAERSRAAVEDRAEASRRALDLARQQPILGARRAIGTDFE
ncbi:MAG: hypothetical protein GXC70_08300 [Sphingomonadaceae bacterium]|nr:hypothetical protein [Sphingomonadaceae bacterium]